MGKRKHKAKLGEYVWSPDIRRIIPLDKGRHCYINDVKGKLHHVKVDTEEFNSLVKDLSDNLSEPKMQEELGRISYAKRMAELDV